MYVLRCGYMCGEMLAQVRFGTVATNLLLKLITGLRTVPANSQQLE